MVIGVADAAVPSGPLLGLQQRQNHRLGAAHDVSTFGVAMRWACPAISAGDRDCCRTMRPVLQHGQAITSIPVCSRNRSHHGSGSESSDSVLDGEGTSVLGSSRLRAVTSLLFTFALAQSP